MNKKHLGIVALFILCFSFALAGKSAQAATTPQETSVSKIAYVDASGRLVLKFADFSDAGYTYTVTNEKTGDKTDTAQLASKKGVLTVSLGQLYSAKTGYKLILTSKDNTKKLTVHYYTGKALGSYSIKQKSNDSVKASWTVSDKIYTGYSLELYLGENSTVAQRRISVGKTAASASIASSSLKNARYYTYLIGQTILNNNKTVYYGNDGTMQYGEQRIDGKWYYFDNVTGAMITGFHQFSNKTVYYGSDGIMQYGEQRINGKWYYFDDVTGAMITGFKKFLNKTVYYGTDGTMQYGQQSIDGKWYYFDDVTGAMITGFKKLSNKTVYYGTDGTMQYGEQRIAGKDYAFDVITGAMIVDGIFNGNYYGATGERQECYLIEGTSQTTVEQMVRYFNKYKGKREYPLAVLEKGGAADIETFAKIFYEEAIRENIKPEVVWAQTMIETGFLQFGGQVKIEQFNFAGLGATDGGAAGAKFENVRMGVRAQVQHLKAYANAEITLGTLKSECVDPRFKLVDPKGRAKYVEWLGQKENPEGKGWATSAGYGIRLRKIIDKILES